MQLNSFYNLPGSKKKSKRVGRGIGSGKGKTCGSGVKGQKSRAGVAINGFEGGQMPMIARLPKRGFNCPSTTSYSVINFDDISRLVENKSVKSGDLVNKDLLVKCGFIKSSKVKVKLLGRGKIDVKLDFDLDAYSKSAKEIVQQAGGKTN
ncbi:MAG: 50S ribosomal protein L15 [Rickettsiaceae bacterium]|nr:50S ribosomal protein L15 [Rickettsiaceae bacterium]